MTATAHALIGASLATKIPNPLIGIPAAILSHFVVDLIPHWDTSTDHKQKTRTRLIIEAVFDVLLGFALIFLFFRNSVNLPYLFVMVLAAQSPDWLKAPSDMFGFNIPPFSWFDSLGHKLQWRMKLPWGLVTQIAVVGLILFATVDILGVSKSLLASLPSFI